MFQHTAARRRLGPVSRLIGRLCCFNTQPPEGGWRLGAAHPAGFRIRSFQHTAARRRLAPSPTPSSPTSGFNTQPPEGGWGIGSKQSSCYARFNTQPPEGGWARSVPRQPQYVGFNTQPPEGGWSETAISVLPEPVSTHSRPKAAGQIYSHNFEVIGFQHTAARRRLAKSKSSPSCSSQFQHTAARRRLGELGNLPRLSRRFNTQPPEGGWP